MSRTIWIVQKPRNMKGLDMDAAERIGEVRFMLPAAPNVHDEQRMKDDLDHMVDIIRNAGPDDAFTFIGGSPFSHYLFGKACAIAGKDIQLGLYSRGRDEDGRRDTVSGSYRLLWDRAPVPSFPTTE